MYKLTFPKGSLPVAPASTASTSAAAPTTADEACDRAEQVGPAESVALLRQALVLDPSSGRAARALAVTLADLGEDGRPVLDAYLERHPLAAEVRQSRGNLHLRAGALEAAADDFRRCIAEGATDGSAEAKLVLALCRLGRREEAEAALAALKKLAGDPRAAEAMTRLVERTFAS